MHAFHLLPALLVVVALPALAAADPEEGRRLAEKAKCEACHAKKAGPEPGAIYLRKDRRVNSLARLKTQVGFCNTELNLSLFPEDEEHIVAYLNRDYYKFPAN